VGRADPQLWGWQFHIWQIWLLSMLGHSSETKSERSSRLAREARLATDPTHKDLVAREVAVAVALEKARGEDTKSEDTSKHVASSEPELQYLLQKAKLLEAQLGQAKWMGKCASTQLRMQTLLTSGQQKKA
jgi:hypothetical protein